VLQAEEIIVVYPHAVDANLVTLPSSMMEQPLYRQVLALMTIFLSHKIEPYKFCFVKLE
jgi:hypothetical protein